MSLIKIFESFYCLFIDYILLKVITHEGMGHLYDTKCKKTHKINTLGLISKSLNVDIPLLKKYIMSLQVPYNDSESIGAEWELRKRLM